MDSQTYMHSSPHTANTRTHTRAHTHSCKLERRVLGECSIQFVTRAGDKASVLYDSSLTKAKMEAVAVATAGSAATTNQQNKVARAQFPFLLLSL